jgi:ribosomal protein L40E
VNGKENKEEITGNYVSAVCKNCGAVFEDDAVFCTKCGTKRELNQE